MNQELNGSEATAVVEAEDAIEAPHPHSVALACARQRAAFIEAAVELNTRSRIHKRLGNANEAKTLGEQAVKAMSDAEGVDAFVREEESAAVGEIYRALCKLTARELDGYAERAKRLAA